MVDQLAVCVGGRKLIQEFVDEEELAPQVVAEEEGFKIIVEGNALKVKDKLRAVLAWVLSHSVSNAKFGKHDRVLGMYLQKLVLKVDDGTKVSTRALKLYSRLCA